MHLMHLYSHASYATTHFLCISCIHAFYATMYLRISMHHMHTCIMQPCVHASHEYMHYASIHSNMHAFYTTMHFMHLMHSRIYAYTHFHAPDACIAHLCILCMTRLPCTSVEVSPWATGSSLWSRRALHTYWSSGYGRHVNAAFILAPRSDLQVSLLHMIHWLLGGRQVRRNDFCIQPRLRHNFRHIRFDFINVYAEWSLTFSPLQHHVDWTYDFSDEKWTAVLSPPLVLPTDELPRVIVIDPVAFFIAL